MMKRIYCFILCASLIPAAAASGAPSGAESIDTQTEAISVGPDLQLFVDDFLIDQMSGLELQLHRPQSAGKALSFDQPWEGDSSTYVSVFKDGDRFRMYYRGSGRETPSSLAVGEKTVAAHAELIAYAESEDGIRWTRPSLGIFEFQGSKENNIVWMDKEESHKLAPCMHVFKDTNPAAAASERYKALGSCSYPLVVLASPDGLHWRYLRGEQSLISDGLHKNAFDAISSAFWDPVKGHYVVFFRDSDRGRREGSQHKKGVSSVVNYGNRSFKYSSSPDFINWSYPQWVDFGSAPTEHLYTNGATPYFRAPQIYLAFPKRFQPWKAYFENWNPGASDGVFLSSRDGIHWDRRFMEAFVRPGPHERNWGHRSNMAAVGILQTGERELSLYYTRHYAFPSDHLERLVLRLDGFASVNAGYFGGEFITKPLRFEGSSILLNFETSAAGSIRLEIQNEKGSPIPGFSLEDSPLIWGDKIDSSVVWKRATSQTDSEPLKRLKGMPVRLRFVMRDADLYSFRFQ